MALILRSQGGKLLVNTAGSTTFFQATQHDEDCCCPECVFSYKRFINNPNDNDVAPDPVYRASMYPDSSLHVADSGHVLAGNRVYNPDGTFRLTAPDAADFPFFIGAGTSSGTERDFTNPPIWLWIAYDSINDKVILFAGHRDVITDENPDTDPDADVLVGTRLTIWKWEELTDTTTQIIEQTYYATPAASSETVEDAFFVEVHIRETAFPGTFETPITNKLGDVRHERIVIAGVLSWYIGVNDEYEYNSEVRCWDFDGVEQWTYNIGDFYADVDTIIAFKYSDNFFPDTQPRVNLPFKSQNHYSGWPKPVRVRIGKYEGDQSVYVLTTQSRVPPLYGFSWAGFDRDDTRTEDGESVQPCLWRITTDVLTGEGTGDLAYWGMPDGIEWEPVIKLKRDDDEVSDLGPEPGTGTGVLTFIAPLITVTTDGTDTYIVTWGVATGGVEPYTYDLIKDGVDVSVADPDFEWIDTPTDQSVARHYRIRVTDSSAVPLISFSSTTHVTRIIAAPKTATTRDLDISMVGTGFIALRTYYSYALIQVPLAEGEDGDSSNIAYDGERWHGYNSTSLFVYGESPAEWAGPAYDTGVGEDGDVVAIIRPCPNGTGTMMKIDMNSQIYTVLRPWTSSTFGEYRIEVSPSVMDGSDITGGEIQTYVAGLAAESDAPCPVHECGPPDEPDDTTTECCPEKRVTRVLPVRRAGLFPASGTITYAEDSGPGGGPAWTGTITGSNCDWTIGLACLPIAEDVYAWHLAIDGGTYRQINVTPDCNPFSMVIDLEAVEYLTESGVEIEFLLACTTLIIGEDDGTIEDVPSLTVTMTFDPDPIGIPTYNLPHTVIPDGCNSYSDSFTASSPCGDRSIVFSLGFSSGNAISITVVVDGVTIFNGLNTYSCDPVSASFGSAAATFCGVNGSVTAVVAETP